MNLNDIKFEEKGLDNVVKALRAMETVPKKYITPSVKKGMKIPLMKAKQDAPYLTGDLERSITLSGEKTKAKSKKVYRIIFKKSIDGKIDTEGNYPIYQEYGYFTKDGRYIPGMHFITDAFNSSTSTLTRTILVEMGTRLEKAVRQSK